MKLKLIGPDYQDRTGCPDPDRWTCWVNWRRADGGKTESFRATGPSKAAARRAAIGLAVNEARAIIAWAEANEAKQAGKKDGK